MHETNSCFRIGMAFAVGLFGFALSACEEEPADREGTPVSADTLCCDCTCTDGVTPCLHYIVEDKEATSCESVCSDACAANEDCPAVDEADVCGGTPPPSGFHDLLCNNACAQVYDECNLSLTDADGLPIPSDQCDRFCQNEVIPIPSLNCLAQIPCRQVYMLECLDLAVDEQLPRDG